MTINIEIDEDATINKEFEEAKELDYRQAITNAVQAAYKEVNCPFEVEVNVILTDNDNIHAINLETRGIDRPTDVLSFPCLLYDEPCDFDYIDENESYLFNPESGDLMFGDILISTDKVVEQAHEYGHSLLRELSFLVIHSMLHLSGYDHMEEDGDTMEKLQAKILEDMNITREL